MVTSREKGSPREILRDQRRRILDLIDSRGGKNVRLFGSLARGDDDVESDIDLIIELPDTPSVGAELLAVLGLSEELSKLTGVRIDVVTPRTLRECVREEALAEAVDL
jgi:predicted nucleotidyltransferase